MHLYKMKRPNWLVNIIIGSIIKIFAFFKGQRIHKNAKIKGPAIILSNHTSFYDFAYTAAAVYPKRANYLAADKMFYSRLLGGFLRLVRAIPKCLFQSDPVATIKVFRILKKNGIVGIFPEGQISPIGVTMEFGTAISKLIKKAKVPVYMVKHRNAYLVNPPWTGKSFKGKIETTVDLIVSRDELDTVSVERLQELISKHMAFNTHAYNEEQKMKIKMNDISNLESVIYQCPECQFEGLKARKSSLYCPNCKSEFFYDEYGKLGGYRLDNLYHQQESNIRMKFEMNKDYRLNSKVRLESYRDDLLVEVGYGEITLSLKGYDFSGMVDGNPVTYHFNPENIPSLPSDLGKNIQIYEGYTIYQFVFDNPILPTQFVIAGEYIHKITKPSKINA